MFNKKTLKMCCLSIATMSSVPCSFTHGMQSSCGPDPLLSDTSRADESAGPSAVSAPSAGPDTRAEEDAPTLYSSATGFAGTAASAVTGFAGTAVCNFAGFAGTAVCNFARFAGTATSAVTGTVEALGGLTTLEIDLFTLQVIYNFNNFEKYSDQHVKYLELIDKMIYKLHPTNFIKRSQASNILYSYFADKSIDALAESSQAAKSLDRLLELCGTHLYEKQKNNIKQEYKTILDRRNRLRADFPIDYVGSITKQSIRTQKDCDSLRLRLTKIKQEREVWAQKMNAIFNRTTAASVAAGIAAIAVGTYFTYQNSSYQPQ